MIQDAALKWLRALRCLAEIIVAIRIFSKILLLKLSVFQWTYTLHKCFVLNHLAWGLKIKIYGPRLVVGLISMIILIEWHGSPSILTAMVERRLGAEVLNPYRHLLIFIVKTRLIFLKYLRHHLPHFLRSKMIHMSSVGDLLELLTEFKSTALAEVVTRVRSYLL